MAAAVTNSLNLFSVVSAVARAKCATNYKVGDKIVVDDANIDLKESTNVCFYALSSLMPYLTPLSRELAENDWMSRVSEPCCQDPHNAVRFRVTRIRKWSLVG